MPTQVRILDLPPTRRALHGEPFSRLRSRTRILARDVAAWRRAYHGTNAALTQLGVDFSAASAPSANACTQLFG